MKIRVEVSRGALWGNELHGPRNQDDRDEHDNAPEPDIQ